MSQILLTHVMEELEQYIGNKLSIVTNGDNGFEGYLDDVSPTTLMIILKKVRFRGTEGRRPEKPVAAHDSVYNTLKLRLSELKEISVFGELDPSANEILEQAETGTTNAGDLQEAPQKPAVVLHLEAARSQLHRLGDDSAPFDIQRKLQLLTDLSKESQNFPIHIMSKANFRYKGIIQEVDQKQGTVCLKDVRCYGTEDREKVQKAPVRNERYPQINFQLDKLRTICIVVEWWKKTEPSSPGSCSELEIDEDVHAGPSKAEEPMDLRTCVPIPPRVRLRYVEKIPEAVNLTGINGLVPETQALINQNLQGSSQDTMDSDLKVEISQPPTAAAIVQKPRQKSRKNVRLTQRQLMKQRQCELCAKVYASWKSLKIHLRLHTGEKAYACHFCDKRFAQSNTLKAHINAHTGRRDWICAICNKSFTQSAHLRTHEKTHSGETNYKCKFCSKKFRCKGTCDRHARIHAEGKPFKCNTCPSAFTRREALNKHMTALHPNVSFQTNIRELVRFGMPLPLALSEDTKLSALET